MKKSTQRCTFIGRLHACMHALEGRKLGGFCYGQYPVSDVMLGDAEEVELHEIGIQVRSIKGE